jgi:hypothetical protein
MAQRLPTRCNPDDRLNQKVLAGTMIKAEKLQPYIRHRVEVPLSGPRALMECARIPVLISLAASAEPAIV